MRSIADIAAESVFAVLARASISSGVTRSFSSSVHFSDMVVIQKSSLVDLGSSSLLVNGWSAPNVASTANRLNFKRLVVVPMVKIGGLIPTVDALSSINYWINGPISYCRPNLVSSRRRLSCRFEGALKAILAYAQAIVRNTTLANDANAVSFCTKVGIFFTLCANPARIGMALMNRATRHANFLRVGGIQLSALGLVLSALSFPPVRISIWY